MRQFFDATNAKGVSRNGVTVEISDQDILELSVSFKYKFMKLETGINTLLNDVYFTRRTTGYAEYGIITF